jgi:hypothetical protein
MEPDATIGTMLDYAFPAFPPIADLLPEKSSQLPDGKGSRNPTNLFVPRKGEFAREKLIGY